jgi:myo-inositol-1(or 4)-monophosphatase
MTTTPGETFTQADIDERFAFATELIAEAGALAASYFADIDSLDVTSKGPQDVVSQADLNTEILIRDRLAARFPDDAFFGEETGPVGIDGAAGIWVVDPIDGTQPFVMGLPTWCVSIAFISGSVMHIGLVLAPVAGELFAAQRGRGATLNGRPISVRPAHSFDDGMVGIGYSTRTNPDDVIVTMSRLLKSGGMFQRNGSGALTLCYVACGRLIGYVEMHINSWDCLAALLLITEAGGEINDFLAGNALHDGNRVVAGPPALYGQLAALLPESPTTIAR